MVKEVAWPPLPTVVEAPLGPVRVVRVRELFKAGDPLVGVWLPEEREIRVVMSASPMNEWAVLHHELTHAIFSDLDVVLPDGPDYHNSPAERVCNAIAFARVQEMRRALTGRKPRRGR